MVGGVLGEVFLLFLNPHLVERRRTYSFAFFFQSFTGDHPVGLLEQSCARLNLEAGSGVSIYENRAMHSLRTF
jgi:hypothetical protein